MVNRRTIQSRSSLGRFGLLQVGQWGTWLPVAALLAALAACSTDAGTSNGNMQLTDDVTDDSVGDDSSGGTPGGGPGGTEPEGSETGAIGTTVPSGGVAGEGTGGIIVEPDRPVDNGPPPPGCNDGVAADEEACDDGNNVSGDGCVANCSAAEDGYICPPAGGPCTQANVCGDGRQSPPETCDDGNVNDFDGCTASCLLEAGFACTVPGEPCQNTVVCGDGVAAGNELCDDVNTVGEDGCSADCTMVEDGWSCVPGAPCIEICGDTKVVGDETCDDGNTASGDGCEANCILGPGFACDATGCHPTVCGDGIKEGAEPCDDGANLTTGDGCSPGCRLEPNCDSADGTCTSNCGDGLLLPGDNEECDDGNDKNSDGCSSDCKFEAGFVCQIVSEADTGVFELPIVYRDFIGIGSDGKPAEQRTDGHPDFENPEYSQTGGEELDLVTDGPGTPGIVETQLGADGTPTYAQGGDPYQTNGAELFNQWFHDAPGVNASVYGLLQLIDNGNGTFIYDNPFFFPIDEAGLVASGDEELRLTDWFGAGCWSETAQGQVDDVFTGPGSSTTGADGDPDLHNFSFTSEVRYWFEYRGGEQLIFRGDDDVWVYIKNQLVVDLGGVHVPMGADVCGNVWCDVPDLCDLDAAPATCTGLGADTVDVSGQSLNLQEGRVYEAVVFQAERHTCQSNYRLTLSGFAQNSTVCQSDCGDGVVAGDEICDDGAMNGTGYGFCNADCTPGPRCGDGVAQPGVGTSPDGRILEECDKALNVDGYRFDETSCAPGCVLPPYCGDGVLNANFGEQCDMGQEGNIGSYDGCNANCTLGPRCGDGTPDAEEECDDGNRANNDGCNLACEKERIRIAR